MLTTDYIAQQNPLLSQEFAHIETNLPRRESTMDINKTSSLSLKSNEVEKESIQFKKAINQTHRRCHNSPISMRGTIMEKNGVKNYLHNRKVSLYSERRQFLFLLLFQNHGFLFLLCGCLYYLLHAGLGMLPRCFL